MEIYETKPLNEGIQVIAVVNNTLALIKLISITLIEFELTLEHLCNRLRKQKSRTSKKMSTPWK